MKLQHLFIIVFCLFITACGDSGQTSRAPIELGDTAYIVTETDSMYLRDLVADMHLKQPPPPPEEEAGMADTATTQATAAVDTTEEPRIVSSANGAAVPKGNGLNIDFPEMQVFIPNISARSFSKNPITKAGASYQLTGGQVNGNQLKISGANITKITQRYQTSVVVKNKDINAVLQSLNYTSGWENMKGGNGTYNITGLDEKQLQYTNATAGKLKDAIRNAVRGKRFSRKKEKEILDELEGVRSVKQAPLKVVLRTVIWQIEGKDKNGKAFRKELRLDMLI